MVISVSSGLMVSIMTRMPTMVTTEVMSCVRLCCRVPAMLSTSLVTRLRISPWVRPSKNFSGSRDELLVDVAPHVVDGLLRDAGHDELLDVAENGARRRTGRSGQDDDLADVGEVDRGRRGTWARAWP